MCEGWRGAGLIWVIVMLLCSSRGCCVVYVGLVVWEVSVNKSSHVWCYGQLRNKIRTQCGLSAILRTNADKCGKLRTNRGQTRTCAGIKLFDWKGKIVYLLVTLDTTKKIQSCMFDTYVIPKYAY